MMENDALLSNIPGKTKHGHNLATQAKQRITNNSSNSAQRLAADQLAMRARLQRDSSRSEDVRTPKAIPVDQHVRSPLCEPSTVLL
ncbi:hypothetical protein AVEN_270706-1 [Araneus ventricosus]|uniref:Uncharacterized protein n=1 Tax=Araneus ventricosus TaxID=182803 RepID=A0A4Y2FDT0_ARAVE|nr:hypothetical protein AVEN_270706-1 [Araneus ventricosus]